jgi:hypothetical protein
LRLDSARSSVEDTAGRDYPSEDLKPA